MPTVRQLPTLTAPDVVGTAEAAAKDLVEPLATLSPTEPDRPSVASAPTAIGTSPPVDRALRISVSAVPASIPGYDRDEWRHWTDEDRDCQDARQEVLITESVTTVEFVDDRECRVSSGRWIGPYTGHISENPRDFDIDHMVPLANAHRSGGWAWDAERKREYANYLDDPGHLIATQAAANRSKGADGPDDWRPPLENYWCQYAVDWITIKERWSLTVTVTEAAALEDMLATCDGPVALEMERIDSPRTPPPFVPAKSVPLPTDVYADCGAAEEAGEQRLRGTRGDGRGFPADMVSSARDGDGDGVVCER